MKNNQLLTAILLIMLVTALSGCICCFGQDGMFSKLKKPVSAISFPSSLKIGGKTYNKVYSNEYLDQTSARAGLKAFASKLGYGSGEFSSLIDKGVELSGIKQYKSFKYSDGSQKGTVGGLVAKTDAPSTVTGGYEAIKQSATAGQSSINDPRQNTGSVKNVASGGSTDLGNGGDRYTMTVNGQTCYAVVVKYSNMYISAYSFESYDACDAAISMAIQQVDEAAAS
jgi:hypothetical protein